MGSLFDGIGGFPLAATHYGITPIWASEIEALPMEVIRIRFPDMTYMGDITKLDGREFPPADVIYGGSPCQDLSVMGHRRGLAGERSGLFMERVRIIKEMRDVDERRNVPAHLTQPRYMVWENAPGVFSSVEDEGFRAVLEEIVCIKDSACHVPRPNSGRRESAGGIILGDHFSLAWRAFGAQYWGVTQRRRRIFLVADFGGLTAPETLFKQESLFGNPAEVGKGRQGTAAPAQGSPDDTVGTKGITAEKESREIFAFHTNQREETTNLGGVSGALLATRNIQMQTFISEKKGTQPLLCLNDQGGERLDVLEEITPTLRTGMGGHLPLVPQIYAAGVISKGNGDCFLTPEAHTSLCGGSGQAGQGYPCILCLNDQGSSVMECSENVSGTLRAQEHGYRPLMLATQQGGVEIGVGVCLAIITAAGISGNSQPVLFENHGIDSRYTSPHAATPTMSTRYRTGGSSVPLVSQGTESFCIAGSIIDRQLENGGNGLGFQADIAYALTGMDRHAVFSRQRSDEFLENEVSATQSARQYKDATDLVAQPCQQIVGTLCMDNGKGVNNQYINQDEYIVENRNLIRRLTPPGCERFQGFPDGWTDIPNALDSARYKALGNGVAIPYVDFVLRGIACFLRRIREECPDFL